jgi:hypothetical protein
MKSSTERATARAYTVCILKAGPKFEMPGPDINTGVTKIIWQHGKRNVALHKAGLMPVVCPIGDGGEATGICVFDTSLEDAERIMSEDPGVKAQVFTYELHPTRSFPLPSR